MQANHATRATNGNPPTSPLYKHLTHHTHSHITSHPVPPRHQKQTQEHGTHRGRDRDPRSAHTNETEAQVMKPRHGSAGALGRTNTMDGI